MARKRLCSSSLKRTQCPYHFLYHTHTVRIMSYIYLIGTALLTEFNTSSTFSDFINVKRVALYSLLICLFLLRSVSILQWKIISLSRKSRLHASDSSITHRLIAADMSVRKLTAFHSAFSSWNDMAMSYVIGRSLWGGKSAYNSVMKSTADELLTHENSPWRKYVW